MPSSASTRSKTGRMVSQPQPSAPSATQSSKSDGLARTAIPPLIIELPPTSRPRVSAMRRPLRSGSPS